MASAQDNFDQNVSPKQPNVTAANELNRLDAGQKHGIAIDSALILDIVDCAEDTALYCAVQHGDVIPQPVYMSGGIKRITGLSAEEIVRNPWALLQRVDADDAARLMAESTRTSKTRERFAASFRFQHADGSWRWLKVVSTPTLLDGVRTIWKGTIVDVTVIHEAYEAKARAEQEQEKAEERLRLALAATTDAIWELNPQTGEAVLPDRLYEMAGYERRDIAPTFDAWASLAYPDDFENGARIFASHLMGELPTFDHVYRMRHKSGKTIWIRTRGRIVGRDAEGRPTRLVGMATDITREKAMEAELEKLAMVARETTNAVSIADRNGRLEWVNEAALRMTGYRFEELVGQPLVNLASMMVPDPQQRRILQEKIIRGESHADEAWVIVKNGQRLFASYDVRPIRDSGGEVIAYLHVAQDITARAIAEEKLKASDEHLRHAQELARFGSWRFWVDTQTIEWSDELYRIFGRDIKLGPPSFAEFIDSIYETDREALLKCIDRAIVEGVGYDLVHKMNRPDGSVRDLHGHGNARRNSEGRVVELYGTSQDITERLNAEKERLELQERLALAQRFESLGVLAGGIAHDFNNLLMGVLMEASVIAKNPRAPIADSLSSIQEAAKRMSELTSQLLAYAGRGQFVVEKLDPNAVVTEMLELLRRNVPDNISLQSEISREPATMEIDGSQLRQVIMNLVINASDALEGNAGLIAVRTRQSNSGASWTLEVTDSGAGMSEDVRKRIFDPFFTTKKSGRGLGLSTVHGIVQRCKGSIEVRSAPGGGSTFIVNLPLSPESAVHAKPGPAPEPESTTLRVLIADDEATVRRSMRRMLELKDTTVVEVADGAAAMDALHHAPEPFDLLLLDVVMPRKNGYEVLAEVRQKYPKLKVILMSGYNNPAAIPGAKSGEQQPDAALQKPFDWTELESTIQSVLEPRQTNTR